MQRFDDFEEIGFSLKECQGETLVQRTDEALKKYKQELIKFLHEIVKTLNPSIRRSIKNHVEFLEEDLLRLFYSQKESIARQIYRKVKVSDAVTFEANKQTFIKQSYASLINLESQL
jgi:hypothetical protein